ncbi:MAG TPA: bifunctional hydroxymethylpyrimidine kinase/phosphomethylpyrimidine kinase [Myxococcota bacterium]
MSLTDVFVDGSPSALSAGGAQAYRISGRRIDSRHTHGTGCTLSAAVVAALAKGTNLETAVRMAHAFVRTAIAQAPGLGHGHGPLHHMHPWYKS